MILPRLSSSAITGSLDPSSHHLKETAAAASLHRAPYVATQPTTNPYIPARSVIPRTRSGGHSDGTHHSSIKTGRLGPRDPTSQHDGSSDKTALIIMGVFLGVGLLLSLLFLCPYVAFVVPKAAEDAEGGLEMPGREALMALLDLRDGKGLLGHKDSEGTRESGGNKDSKEIKGNKENRALPG
ncbi:unnamed protein product [Clonostachys chloroleuca]|uniref:Uncharacterized protein n=1 Tax=Clonostachys chloroleuca TaxID=1926264 RepID=A0AA35M3N0_9HYPO|nr:unnamed protein product [Clonostachys chloroleuca]